MQASYAIILLADSTGNPMKTFIGLPASATARPQRSEDSQADGCPRPALEGKEKEAKPVMGSPV
jgi:hypothetical protein